MPPPPTPPPAVLGFTLGLFSCSCCIAFARRFPLLSTGRSSSLLLHLPLLTHSSSLFVTWSKLLFFLSLKVPFFFLCNSSPPPPPPPEHGINWRGGRSFPPCLSGALFFSTPPLSDHSQISVPPRGSACLSARRHSIPPSLLAPPRPWCQVWGLRSVPKCLQSTELQTSLQHFF